MSFDSLDSYRIKVNRASIMACAPHERHCSSFPWKPTMVQLNSPNTNAGEAGAPRKEKASYLFIVMVLLAALVLFVALFNWMHWRSSVAHLSQS
jgi:hypothetical protein